MLGGIFDKNKIKDKIKNFDKKIFQENFWEDKLTAQKIQYTNHLNLRIILL